ncbi:MAG TPA: Rv3654c family TadE-like protein [Bacillota bacterium]|nr:Rv3654c family TadE-like protein [Bacillota bacterium]
MTDRRRPFVADERGSGSMLTLMTVALTLMAFLVVLVVGSYLIADHRAVAAADRAALSGARAHGAPGGRQQEASSACETARRVAELNGARMTGCRITGDRADYVVQVTVVVDVGVLWPGLPAQVPGSAHAGRLSG